MIAQINCLWLAQLLLWLNTPLQALVFDMNRQMAENLEEGTAAVERGAIGLNFEDQQVAETKFP